MWKIALENLLAPAARRVGTFSGTALGATQKEEDALVAALLLLTGVVLDLINSKINRARVRQSAAHAAFSGDNR